MGFSRQEYWSGVPLPSLSRWTSRSYIWILLKKKISGDHIHWICGDRISKFHEYFGQLIWTANSLKKILMLEKIQGKRRREWQRMRWLDRITDLMDMNLGNLWERVRNWEAWRDAVHEVAKSQTWLSDWTTKKIKTDICWPHCGRLCFLIHFPFISLSLLPGYTNRLHFLVPFAFRSSQELEF